MGISKKEDTPVRFLIVLMVLIVYAESGDGYVSNWNSDWATARNAATGQEVNAAD